jgi:hypothetical protein
MPRDGWKWRKLTDLFTTDELNRAMILLLECEKTKEDFNARCTKELVGPVMSRVNANAWQNNSPASLVYRLKMYARAVKGGERATTH